MSSDGNERNGNGIGSRRKLRVLVITMGGNRKKQIENLFSDKSMSSTFESPTFSDGVLSRSLRNRYHFFRIANEAGLLPEQEWIAIQNAYEQNNILNEQNKNKQETFFDCLQGIEANTTKKRMGSEQDIKLHYSVELWRKSKSINRGRSVLACLFAHLIALKKLVDSSSSSDTTSFDLIVEDNIRLDPKNCAEKVWDAINACEEWEKENNNNCHLRFFGWLGSNTNLEWIMKTHIPKRKYIRKDYNDQDRDLDLDRDDCNVTIVPFPCLEHLEEDLSVMMDGELDNCATTTTTTTREKNDVGRIEEEEEEKDEKSDTKNNETNHIHNKPGGNLCWGAYAYWMSNEGYESLMETLRNDVGAILWKGKRQRHYSVKPIDKILPRQTIANFGSSSVQISSQPAFFRAPMLTSKIHSKWDPGFCDATEYQLQSNNLDWYNLSLTDTEREIVSHHKNSGKWITEMELQSSSDVDIDASASANNTAI